MVATTTKLIANWVVHTGWNDYPERVRLNGRDLCFDGLGVMVAGRADEVGKQIVEYVSQTHGDGDFSIVATDIRTTSAGAALANGTLAHALDYDSAGGFGHPTAFVLPALLTLAQQRPTSGQALLEAFIAGCEVGQHLFAAGERAAPRFDQMEHGIHASGLFGRLAATVACAKLSGLDADQIATALGLVASTCSGLVRNFGTMVKPLHAGLAARDAILAVDLAARRWTACGSVIEGSLGLMDVFWGNEHVQLEQVAARLGRMYLSTVLSGIKAYPTCGHNHPAIEAIRKLKAQGSFRVDEIRRVLVTSPNHPREVLLYDAPQDGLEAKFSLRYNVAAALLWDDLGIDAFSAARVRDPRVTQLMQKVELHVDAGGTGSQPRRVTVEITLEDGRTLSSNATPAEVPGSSTRPFDERALKAKYRSSLERVYPPDVADEMATRCFQWTDIQDVNEVLRRLSAALPDQFRKVPAHPADSKESRLPG
jgi:2-methylcitrate dehydratase PrpD